MYEPRSDEDEDGENGTNGGSVTRRFSTAKAETRQDGV